ncbi:family 43 glycosylhydrolase [Gilvimarinus sp. SDUM040013]|uniref:Family 43 glycosylhydrolase n=1 Tax=Gilvimarinus gilvus TaxID=3058038 RepID=A0ABU4RZB0_9GAMM|nr:family 43 glycosylhydrolase [Gilvimarinus sp. SDUM040013]MDO3387244.1 family 43 glycosylhydrolase [Gilvimarinus sp. SDUM040013]MDX6848933.1 family 43 glycosylhydrolase [Gilvimarinus sp. SDUM040013]
MIKWKKFTSICALAAVAGCAQTDNVANSAQEQTLPEGYFANPLFANGADPWLEYWDGNYYLTTTTWTSQLVMRKSPTLAGLSEASPINVWSDTDPARSWNFWAFEFHRLNGPNGWRWYLMYTAGVHGTLDHQHLSVLESAGDDPMGPYEYKGHFMPNEWNIDGTYLEHDGKLYLLYSQWHGPEQLNLITEMETPWTLKAGSPKVVITRPELDWEISGREVTEGAEILKHKGRTFLIYSASYCDTPDYKLGMKELIGSDPLNPDHWKQYEEPVFQRGNGVFGPGHNGFFVSPDGTQDWIVYHGNSKEEYGCGSTRSVRAQQFTWTDEGLPNFGDPIPEGEPVKMPSGENGPIKVSVQGVQQQLVNRAGKCLVGNGGDLALAACAGSKANWVLDSTADGAYRLAHVDSGTFIDQNEQATPWVNTDTQRWTVATDVNGWLTLTNRDTGATLGGNDAQWRLAPTGDVAVMSVQSGKALVADGGNVAQDGWQGSDLQKWQFSSTSEAFYSVKLADQCMTLAGNPIVPGANAVLGSCDGAEAEWAVVPLGDGSVQLRNRHSGLSLNADSCALANGANLSQSPWFDNDCQKFQLREVN